MRRGDLLTMIKEMLGNRVELTFLPTDPELHYKITPYSFSPKTAKVYRGDSYLDLGQGLLQGLSEIHEKYCHGEELDRIFVPNSGD